MHWVILSLKIGLKIYHKPMGMWNFFCQKTDKRISCQELEKMNIWTLDDFLWKLLKPGSIERTVMNFKKCCLYVVLVLPGSAEIQLR